jgi:hypothetical protein
MSWDTLVNPLDAIPDTCGRACFTYRGGSFATATQQSAGQSGTSYQAGTGASELAKDADPDLSPARSPAADPVRA